MSVTTMSSFRALVKREYWEHQRAIFKTPLVIALFFAGLMILGALTGDHLISINGEREFSIVNMLPKAIEGFEALTDDEQQKAIQISLYGTRMLFGFVMLFVCFYYALASLYDERKDKSILFWKSLPISDTATVLSKFVGVCLLTPTLYFIVTAGFQLFELLFATVGAWFGGSFGVTIWTSSNLFGVLFNSFFSMIAACLWLAPLWAWSIFASSWAKKTAFLWMALPIFLITIAEGWIFHSREFISMVFMRIAGGFMILNSNLNQLVGNKMFKENSIEWYNIFGLGEFWIGLIVSAIFLAGAIYTRRYRDEA